MTAGTDCTEKIAAAAAETLGDRLPRIDVDALARDLAAVSRRCAAGGITEREALLFARLLATGHVIRAWCTGAVQP